LAGFSQQSTIQEQSSHYRSYGFAQESQWDSLRTTEQGNALPYSSALRAVSSGSCTLTKKVYGWHPYWVGSVYTNYDWDLLSDFCYFDYSVSPT
ncbi:UNVERIFIED_CONTAM: hypothetical protein IGO34_27870, partial [Salmonella enterica subsp. enterica serovar Weltevreden]